MLFYHDLTNCGTENCIKWANLPFFSFIDAECVRLLNVCIQRHDFREAVFRQKNSSFYSLFHAYVVQFSVLTLRFMMNKGKYRTMRSMLI